MEDGNVKLVLKKNGQGEDVRYIMDTSFDVLMMVVMPPEAVHAAKQSAYGPN